jgi:ABC-type branched-subunit amino acid transport system permease subunit
VKGLTVIILGGLGNIGGAVIGGFVVAGLEVFSVAAGQSNFAMPSSSPAFLMLLSVRRDCWERRAPGDLKFRSMGILTITNLNFALVSALLG